MKDSNNSSFIPKQSPAKKRKVTSTRKVYLFTLISYVLMFATIIAAAGVFFYQQYMEGQLEAQVTTLNNEINVFDQSDMQRVLEFDRRLTQAEGRLENSVSIASIFGALEDAVVSDVQLNSLSIERDGDSSFNMSADLLTDSFDATLFQRGVFQRTQLIDAVSINDIETTSSSVDGESSSDVGQVRFAAELEVALADIPFIPETSDASDVEFEAEEPEDLSATSSEMQVDSEVDTSEDTATSTEEVNNNEAI